MGEMGRLGSLVPVLGLVIAACCARPPPRTAAEPLPPTVTAVAKPPPAPRAFTYYFNRNALTASVRTASGDLIALTDSGNLLMFDAQTCS